MRWADAEHELRHHRLDDAQGEQLWTEPELRAHFNDAIQQSCIRIRCLTDSVTPAVCRRPIQAGAQFIKLHPRILAVRTVQLPANRECGSLRGITARRLFRADPRWNLPDASAPEYGPRFWVPDYQERQLWFDRPVEHDDTVHLMVWRLPLEAEEIEGPDDEPPIPEAHHRDLLDWVEYRAYSKRDAETNDPDRAARAAQAYEAKTGPLPSAVAMRLWGVSPIVGTTPQFV